MKQGFFLQVSQRQSLSPQLQQSIRILQLTTLELEQEIQNMLAENPFLEQEDETLSSEGDATSVNSAEYLDDDTGEDKESNQADTTTQANALLAPELDLISEAAREETDRVEDWAGDGSEHPDHGEWGVGTVAEWQEGTRKDNTADASLAINLTSAQETLAQHLKQQAALLRLDDVERAVVCFLIDSLNEDGYLEDSLETLALTLEDSDTTVPQNMLQSLESALSTLQTLDPIGVGARSLQECLTLQIAAASEPQTPVQALALRICAQPLEMLAKRPTKQLARICQTTEAQTQTALRYIARLDPKPGRQFERVVHEYIIPDVLVSAVLNPKEMGTPQFRVQINPDVMPRLRIYEPYTQIFSSGGKHDKLHQHVQEARWFIKSLYQRFDTLQRVASAIVGHQQGFFLHGAQAMKPLQLREIAEDLDLHLSTISRATTGKYLASTQGVFELKYFFSSSLGAEDDAQAASGVAVRARIQQLIEQENPKQPLSDNCLSALLKKEGIVCARRTVAKYRESIKVAAASARKQR